MTDPDTIRAATYAEAIAMAESAGLREFASELRARAREACPGMVERFGAPVKREKA